MTDKELLELAAKAAGVKYKEDFVDPLGGAGLYVTGGLSRWYWNPLTDDGDALRLAVKLGLWFYIRETYTDVMTDLARHIEVFMTEQHGDDPYTATRRAIVRAAAEIGRTL